MTCCCSLAGTQACQSCVNNPDRSVNISSTTTTTESWPPNNYISVEKDWDRTANARSPLTIHEEMEMLREYIETIRATVSRIEADICGCPGIPIKESIDVCSLPTALASLTDIASGILPSLDHIEKTIGD